MIHFLYTTTWAGGCGASLSTVHVTILSAAASTWKPVAPSLVDGIGWPLAMQVAFLPFTGCKVKPCCGVSARATVLVGWPPRSTWKFTAPVAASVFPEVGVTPLVEVVNCQPPAGVAVSGEVPAWNTFLTTVIVPAQVRSA